MIRNTWKPALALGAVLALGSTSRADDARQLTGASGTTMTLGGKGTAEQAATEDTELAGGYRGYYGGYRGYGYGGGYRGGYYSSYYRGGYGGYYGGYRGYGGYNSFSYYRPAYYYAPRVYPAYYRPYPVYSSFYYGGYGSGFGFSIGIGGDSLSLSAPAVQLGAGVAPPTASPMARPAAPGDGTFRYDGGPAVPVPLPKADPQPIPPANSSASTDLPVSLKPKAATSPYKYKAYGEK